MKKFVVANYSENLQVTKLTLFWAFENTMWTRRSTIEFAMDWQSDHSDC